jgi:hypothetical protein
MRNDGLEKIVITSARCRSRALRMRYDMDFVLSVEQQLHYEVVSA